MPRGRKPEPHSTEEQIAKIDSEIDDYKQKISHAREKRKSLFMNRKKRKCRNYTRRSKPAGKRRENF